jgi:preprotein translocase subunit SecD
MKLDFLKHLLREWKVSLVLICVIGSLILIAPNPFSKGVVVTSITSTSPLLGKLQVGEAITWANEKDISSPEDLLAFENFTGTFRFMHSGKLDLVYLDEHGLGISVVKKPASNIQFGMDLIGGTRVLLKPKGVVSDAVIQQIISILETRINVFGLKEVTFQPIKDFSGNSYIQVEMAGGSREDMENLLAKEGKFEGKIERIVSLKNNTGSFLLNGKTYSLRIDNNNTYIGNISLIGNQTVKIDNIDVQNYNTTNDTAVIMLTAFTGSDIQSVCLQNQPGICTNQIIKSGNGWEFNFQVFITQKGAERFANLTKDMNAITDPSSGTKYLDGKIYLFLDENLVTSLSIASDLKGKAYTTPAITGFRTTRDDALKEQLTLEGILQSGSLPVSLEITRVDQISPALGEEFINATILSALVAALAVSVILFIRYRSFKILIPNMLWSFFEIVLTLGAATLIRWTIDLSSIAGLIAAIGQGTNDQVMIIDEVIEGEAGEENKIFTIKERLKRAFFIVVGSAVVIMMSVVPMIFIGIGVMKGFAITTLLGTFIGAILTRPAFSLVAQKVLEGRVEKKLEKKIESDASKKIVEPEKVKEEIIKKEWNKLLDMASKELYNRPFNELAAEEKAEVKKILSETEEKETKR